MGSDGRGRIVILADDRLMLWDRQVVEITRFAKPIHFLTVLDGEHALVTLRDNDLHVVALTPGAIPRRVLEPSANPPMPSRDGRTLVAVGNGRQLNIIELPSGARWTLPRVIDGQPFLSLAPTARQILQATGGPQILHWTLPTSAPDFAAWLDAQTNAVKHGDGVLAWPWQLAAP